MECNRPFPGTAHAAALLVLLAADEWQAYAHKIVQLRHRAENVQAVPDRVRGDAGIEFFSLDGCLYQCYAPEEAADTAKAASAMKAKATRDLKKLEKNQEFIKRLLPSIKRWILLCPFLDDKSVVAHVRAKGAELRAACPSLLRDDFEALVQSQEDFQAEIEWLRQQSLGPPLHIVAPDDDAIASAEGEIGERLTAKLRRAFPGASEEKIATQKAGYVRAHLLRENTLEQLRIDHSLLWERSVQVLSAEEARLVAVGHGTGAASAQLETSVLRIEQSLKSDLPNLPTAVATQIALGTIGDWLVRCPLDFPGKD